MENIYFEWTLADDKLLYDNRYLSTVRLASLLGRGMHGVEARLKKLSDVNSSAYARLLFAGSSSNIDAIDDEQQQQQQSSSNKGLTPVKEVWYLEEFNGIHHWANLHRLPFYIMIEYLIV